VSDKFCYTFLLHSSSTDAVKPQIVVGLTASCFGLGATLSNLLGQIAVEHLGHIASLTGSLIISIIPIFLFGFGMPETYGKRGSNGNGNQILCINVPGELS
jgi:hypothetical protein